MLVVATVVSAQTPGPTPAPALAGAWEGVFGGDMGEMPVTASFVLKDGVITGALQTIHGERPLTKSALTDGVWVLHFAAPEGGTGSMTGAIKDDVFSGKWDFSPMATGTFSLKRTKSSGVSPASSPRR